MTAKPSSFRFSTEHQRDRWKQVSAICNRHIVEATSLSVSSSTTPYTFGVALQSINRTRNRYTNVLPWDRTRVILSCTEGSDFINALFLRLANKTYIAAQGPLPSTIPHFWAMCFDQAEKRDLDVLVVLMITPLEEGGVVKCAKYWPSRKEPVMDFSQDPAAVQMAHKDLKVEWVSEEVKEFFTFSTFALSAGGKTITVRHYYYGKWEDCMPPSSNGPLGALSEELELARKAFPTIAPIIHCSAGVGRTGTLIVYDHLVNGLESFGNGSTDPIFNAVVKIREQRMMMVQTFDQFRFLYQVLEEIVDEAKQSKFR